MMTMLEPYPGVSVRLTEAGAGRPVLVLHGGAGPESVAGLVDRLSTSAHVLAPTHPGWAGTERPDWFTGVDSLVETYHDLLDDRDLRGVSVVGSSFGGWIAAELAVRDRGGRIGRLVLVDAIGPAIEGHEIHVPGGGTPPGAPPGPRRGPLPGDLAALRAYAGAAMTDPKLLSRLARIRVRVLVLWGALDPVVTPDFGRAYAKAFRDARFEQIAGAGHVPMRDQPDLTHAFIEQFLGEN
jgi:pimeloyl-ACP methyl ester carboxylesterase